MRHLATLLMMAVVFTAYSQPKDEIKLLPEAKRQKMSPDLVKAFSAGSFDITSTAKLGSYFMNENYSFDNIARVHSYSGVFEASYFQISPANNAIRFWYCYNPTNQNYPTFFLALEQIQADASTKKDPENSPVMNDTLMVPSVFPYNRQSSHFKEILDYIQKDTSTGSARKIAKREVMEFAQNFRSLLSIISPRGLGPYCKYMVSIFEKTADYDDFMNRNGGPSYVRYYIGLSQDPEHDPNFLRPVLAGVDAQGRTVYDQRNLSIGTFLQKSVPPPPYNN